MKLPRRQFLRLAAAAATLPAMSGVVRAQTYPTRPVRIVTSFPAGNVDDLLARLIGQSLSARLGQPFVLDNQPLPKAIEAIVSALPDGHTLFLVTAANVIRTILDEKLNFHFVRDVAPVAGISRNPFVLVVNPSFSTKTIPELVAYTNSNPGKLNMASGGTGTLAHLAGELFEIMTRVKMVHAPYDGAVPAVSAVLNGQAQLTFATMPSAIQQIRADKLRALAVTSVMRSQILPDIPTVSDFVPSYEASGFQGICAPKNTPTDVIDKLSKEINAALADPQFKEHLGEFGNTLLAGSTAEYGKTIANETEKWTKVIRAANITLG
jgi:tripartite-type tricarboxylate transporter receptor subunit TctC